MPLFELDGAATLPDGVIVTTIAEAAREHGELLRRHLGSVVGGDDVFTMLNDTAEYRSGSFVYVPRGVALERADLAASGPVAGGHAAAPAHADRARGGCAGGGLGAVPVRLPRISTASSTWSPSWSSPTTRRLRYVCGQDLSEKSWIFGAQRAEVGRDASLDWVALGFGSARGRVRMETRLGGEGAEARVTGAYASHARQHIDFDTTQEHAAPNTTSDLAFRGVLQGRSTAVWKGNIIVDPGAQKTDAFQESRNLLLSKRAHADAIPGLEIQANDVRCTHAAAVAQVDPEQLFYLRSHGLREDVAKRLVIEGFLAALVERFEQGPVREVLGDALERRLGRDPR